MADLRCHGRIAAHPGCCGPARGHPAAHAAAEATAGAARRRPAETSMIKVRPGKLTFPNVRTTRLASGIGRSRCGCRRWAPPRGAARAAGRRAATAGPARGRPRSARAASWPARSARGRPCVTGPRPARLIVGLALEAASTRPLTDVPHCRRAPLERRALRRTGASSRQSRFGWDTRAFHTGEAVTVLSMADHGGLAMLASRDTWRLPAARANSAASRGAGYPGLKFARSRPATARPRRPVPSGSGVKERRLLAAKVPASAAGP